MKAIIQKNKLSESFFVFDDQQLEHSEEIMKKTWSEFREALANKEFEYTDTDKASKVTFLKQFDSWFQGVGKGELVTTLSEFFCGKFVGRGTIIKPHESQNTPSHDRFMPVSKFITEDNRFSPAGVEWLYLAVGDTQEIIQECAEKECRVKSGDRFAFCNFQVNEDYHNIKIVNLSIADDFSYENIKEGLYALEQREYAKGIKYAQKHGIWAYKLHYKNLQAEKEIAKWALYTYAKIMSNNLFVPIKTQDKKIEYAPFQTLAIYFIRAGFDGIIYSSTVCPNAKNIVLFDKKYAVPFGNVSDYTFGPLSL